MTIDRRRLFSLLVLSLAQTGCFRLPGDDLSCDADRIRTESLPEGAVGVPYSFRLERRCETLFTDWRLSGDLPPGMVLSSSGHLSGTPTAPGAFSFAISLHTFGFVETVLDSRPFTLVVRPATD
jgi:hypothetical protein